MIKNDFDDMVCLKWYCGLYVGSLKWHGIEFFEPDECGNEFETEECIEEVEDKLCSAVCPKCGGILTMRDDDPHIVDKIG